MVAWRALQEAPSGERSEAREVTGTISKASGSRTMEEWHAQRGCVMSCFKRPHAMSKADMMTIAAIEARVPILIEARCRSTVSHHDPQEDRRRFSRPAKPHQP